MTIQLFNTSCALVGVIDDYTSFTFLRSYSGVGDWTLVLSAQSPLADLIYDAAYIRVGPKRAGIITKIVDTWTAQEKTITVTGIELKGLASKRLVYPPAGEGYLTFTGAPEAAIAALISSQITNPSDTARQIPGTIAAYSSGSDSYSYSGRYSVTADDIAIIAATYGVGWYADIENGRIVWHIFRGVDRTAAQAVHNRLMISQKLDSYAGSSYSEARHAKNTVVVAGQGEGADRAIAVVNDANTGLARTEMFVDARDVTDAALLPQRGQEKLAELGDSATFEPTPEYGAFVDGYMIDYDLGDIGTLLEDDVNFRLATITEVYEVGQPPLTFGFGYDGVSSIASALSGVSARVQALETEDPIIYPLALKNGGTAAQDAAGACDNIGALSKATGGSVNGRIDACYDYPVVSLTSTRTGRRGGMRETDTNVFFYLADDYQHEDMSERFMSVVSRAAYADDVEAYQVGKRVNGVVSTWTIFHEGNAALAATKIEGAWSALTPTVGTTPGATGQGILKSRKVGHHVFVIGSVNLTYTGSPLRLMWLPFGNASGSHWIVNVAQGDRRAYMYIYTDSLMLDHMDGGAAFSGWIDLTCDYWTD